MANKKSGEMSICAGQLDMHQGQTVYAPIPLMANLKRENPE
ncbi:MAG: hypothetical protein AAF441_14265 [Pseudomonadota bacterium]